MEAADREDPPGLGPEDPPGRRLQEPHPELAAGQSPADGIPHDPVAPQDLADNLLFGEAQEPGFVGQGDPPQREAFTPGRFDHFRAAQKKRRPLFGIEEGGGRPDPMDALEPVKPGPGLRAHGRIPLEGEEGLPALRRSDWPAGELAVRREDPLDRPGLARA